MSSTSMKTGNANQCTMMQCLNTCEVLKWSDQKKSGGVFAVGLVTLYMLKNYTLLGLIAYTLLYSTVICSTWVLIKNVIVAFQNNQNGEAPAIQAHPFQNVLDFVPKKVNFKEEQVAKAAKKLTALINKFINCSVSLVLAKSISSSVGFAGVLYFTSGILARFEFLSLAIFFWIAIFTVPVGYQFKKAEVDALVVKVWEPIQPHYIKIQSMIMKYKNANNSLNEQKDE